MPSPRSSSWILYILAGLIVLGGVVFAVTRTRGPSPYDGFAQCLTEKGVTMYGAWWCPHCATQKKMFGSAFQYVKYIECSSPQRTMLPVCAQANIESFPTWEFADGSRQTATLSLEQLSQASACPLPTL